MWFLCGLVLLFCDGATSDRYTCGVSPSALSQYAVQETFQCLNGEKSVPKSWVNDDYCDCTDGSDEPGTSACTTGPGYYCKNEGHKSKVVKPYQVGDGVCDCCDGSDEWILCQPPPQAEPTNKPSFFASLLGWGPTEQGSGCKNTCQEEGAKSAKEEAALLAKIEKTAAIRADWCARGVAAKENRAVVLRDSETKMQDINNKIQQAEANKQKLEEVERSLGEDEKTKVQEQFNSALSLGTLTTDQLHDTLIHLAWQNNERSCEALIDIVAEMLKESHQVETDELLSLCLNEEHSRPQVAEARDRLKALQDQQQQHQENPDAEGQGDMQQEIEEAQAAVSLEETLEQSERIQKLQSRQDQLASGLHLDTLDSQLLQTITLKLNQKTRLSSSLLNKVSELRDQHPPEGIVIPEDAPAFTHPEAEQARQHLSELENEKSVLEDTVEEERKVDKMDFGDEQEFYPLKEDCISYTSGEHHYEVCPYGQSTQGGRSIGEWEGFVDAPFSHNLMRWGDGDGWGCPENRGRDLEIHVYCGTENKIFQMEEPEMCSYRGKMETPAACKL